MKKNRIYSIEYNSGIICYTEDEQTYRKIKSKFIIKTIIAVFLFFAIPIFLFVAIPSKLNINEIEKYKRKLVDSDGNFGFSEVELDAADNLLPSKTFLDDYVYKKGEYHYYEEKPIIWNWFHVKPEIVIIVLQYDENIYLSAKNEMFSSFHKSSNPYYYDDYVFYMNKVLSTDTIFPRCFTMASYNDTKHILCFLGYFDGLPGMSDEYRENMSTNWKDFIDENYEKYYDFSK